MAASFAFLRDLRPYKTSWRVQVKILHSWRPCSDNVGETLEMVLADEKGVKIHASIKKDLVSRYANQLPQGEWRFIENFGITQAVGKYRPTNHFYKMGFLNGTVVTRSDPISDSYYLTLAEFKPILNGELNPYMLIDVIGQIVNVGELQSLEVQNKPTKKLDFELRDTNDERLPCTLWGTFAEQVFSACEAADGIPVVCLIRFGKIKSYKGIISLSNSYDASQVLLNPDFPEVIPFTQALPTDGLTLTYRESVPKNQIVIVQDDDYSDYPRKTIAELIDSTEIGKARVMCTIYAIDTDWGWYYFSCKDCNKKVTHIYGAVNGIESKSKKQKFWCEVCKKVVTNVIPRYMIYIKVMDNTGESKCLLFDSLAADIITETASSVLGGSLAEIVDPEDLPVEIKNLIGKTFLFLLSVEKENIYSGKDSYKVAKLLRKDGLLAEDVTQDSGDMIQLNSNVSENQVPLMLTNSQDTTESMTPSSKRVLAFNVESSEQSSTTKKLCMNTTDLDYSEEEAKLNESPINESEKLGVHKDNPVVNIKEHVVATKKFDAVKVKIEKK